MKQMTMKALIEHPKELPAEFEGKGEVKNIHFRQIAKSEKAYVYERSDGCFEVFRRKENRRFAQISYPKSNAFGMWAWCTYSHKRAFEIFDRLNSEPIRAIITAHNGANSCSVRVDNTKYHPRLKVPNSSKMSTLSKASL